MSGGTLPHMIVDALLDLFRKLTSNLDQDYAYRWLELLIPSLTIS